MKKIVFASNNQHKLHEVRAVLSDEIEILSLADINFFDEIKETGCTLEENALIKAKHIHDKYDIDCMADDTGLEVEELNGEPGVFSARYAGEDQNSQKNIEKLLQNLKEKTNRNARFRTVIALIENKKTIFFEGIISGKIIDVPRGTSGFGYDSVFVPDGQTKTFAELGIEQKNLISHRAIAVKKFAEYMKLHRILEN